MYKMIVSVVLLLSMVSCGDTYQSDIPNKRVDMKINLLQSPYFKIDNSPYFLEVKQPSKYDEYVGYSGLIIGYSVLNGFCAYDLCCPIEAQQNVRVSIQKENWKAVCAKCGSEYDLMNGGVLTKGEKGAYLKSYKAEKTGEYTLYVHN
ncbi:hypothetical protein HMPREF1214_01001 [Bacteroides sp. HPS0048]|uniref:hypothetical protein n=1 Tax=Bacteroides sp. HPS0048 TaxID=1078089 RepID=UPI0003758D59|nr:hypothetical protein [Bacteroides sp. HPS0048]EOA59752.1 hypothetical protein HMPREF1214_01001 [Bacteroides sp. HPS0048]